MGGAGGRGGVEQPAIISTALHPIAAQPLWSHAMMILFLEALGALLIFVFIIWWTMFSGRKKGELPSASSDPKAELPQPTKPEKTDASDNSA